MDRETTLFLFFGFFSEDTQSAGSKVLLEAFQVLD